MLSVDPMNTMSTAAVKQTRHIRPVPLEAEVILKVQQQIIARHLPTSEKSGRHPPLVECICEVFMHKNMNKEQATWLHPGADSTKQFFVVLHVLKHFNAQYSVHHLTGEQTVKQITHLSNCSFVLKSFISQVITRTLDRLRWRHCASMYSR